MTSPAAKDTTQALKDNAKQLGLTWDLRPGTIVAQLSAAPSPGAVSVLLDGDDTPVPAILIGALTNPRRVMVLLIPPAGFYIIGSTGSLTDLVSQDHQQATTGAISAETAVHTGGVANFHPGSAYELHFAGQLTNAAANTSTFRVRRDTAAGTLIAGAFNEQRAAAASSWFETTLIVANFGTTVISCAPCLTLATSASTSTFDAASTRTRYLEVRWAGFAGQYPNAAAM
jgi:hypothetical protein